jgi:hypothetical protein
MTPDNDHAIYFESLPKGVGYFILSLMMVAVSAVCVAIGGVKATVVGWCGLVFFGFAAFLTFSRLFRRGPRLIISPQGIDDIRDGWGLIPWNEIEEIKTATVQKQEFIILVVSDPEKFVQRQSTVMRGIARVNASLLGTPIFINTQGLSGTTDEIFARIRSFYERVGTE